MIPVERSPVPSRDSDGLVTVSTTATSGAAWAPRQTGEWLSSKLRPRHLQRQAIVYVRQSSPHQVAENGESLARQYALRDRAAALGWPASNVILIDDDLGVSGRGTEERPGFQRLLADVAQDRVGLVLALEMSRLRATVENGIIFLTYVPFVTRCWLTTMASTIRVTSTID